MYQYCKKIFYDFRLSKKGFDKTGPWHTFFGWHQTVVVVVAAVGVVVVGC